MNPLLRTFLVVLIALPTFAQDNFEYIYSKTPFSTIEANLLINQQLYTAGAVGECISPVLRVVDGQEDVPWYSPIGGYWAFQNLLFLPDQDSTLITGGYYRTGDDYGTNNDGPRILGYDLNGNLRFDTPIPAGSRSFDLNSRLNFIVNGDEEIVAIHLDTLHWLSIQGDYIKEVVHPFMQMVDLVKLNDTTMLGVTESSFIWMNNDGTIIRQLPVNGSIIRGIEVINSKAYAFTVDYILEVLDSISILPLNNLSYSSELEPIGITGNSSSLFLWGKDKSSDFSKFLQYDIATSDMVQNTLFEQVGTIVKDVVATETQLFFSGDYTTDEGPASTSFAKSVDILDINFVEVDIALDDVRILNELSSYVDGGQTYYSARPLIYEFDVTNLGPDSVFSLGFYTNRYDGFNCAIAHLYNYISGIAIPPGERVTITDSSDYIYSTSTGSNYTPQLNFHVYAPNHRFDGDRSNNVLTEDLPVPTQELNFLLASEITLFPNPADQSVQLQLPQITTTESIRLMIFDVQGKKMQEQFFENGLGNEGATIKTSSFPDGIYFLQLLVGKTMINKKLVVQH